jgi:hypothetical protein
MAVARSSDGGKTYPHVTFFEFSGGEDHFNDKPMITADTNPSSPFRDNVYVAWDAALGGSGSGFSVGDTVRLVCTGQKATIVAKGSLALPGPDNTTFVLEFEDGSTSVTVLPEEIELLEAGA